MFFVLFCAIGAILLTACNFANDVVCYAGNPLALALHSFQYLLYLYFCIGYAIRIKKES